MMFAEYKQPPVHEDSILEYTQSVNESGIQVWRLILTFAVCLVNAGTEQFREVAYTPKSMSLYLGISVH